MSVCCGIVEMMDWNAGTAINPLKEHTISSRLCSANYLYSELICFQFYSLSKLIVQQQADNIFSWIILIFDAMMWQLCFIV